jgi:hypothetical protein
MDQRPALGTPVCQQACYILFGLRVIARTPIRMIDRQLQVDQQQDGASRRI